MVVEVKGELRRLDLFQARCLRQILKVRSPYISRISNKMILQRCGAQQVSVPIPQKQQQLLDNVILSSVKSQHREVTFISASTVPLTRRYVQRKG